MKELDQRLVEVSDEEFIEYVVDALNSDAFSCVFVDTDSKKVVMHKYPGQNGKVWSWLKFFNDTTKGK